MDESVGFETRFEIFNVTDEQVPVAYPISVRTSWVDGGTAAQNHTFGYPTGYTQFQTPRRYGVQFALMW